MRKRGVDGKRRAKRSSDPREAALIERGVRPSMAASLVREHSDSAIRSGINRFDELTRGGRQLALDNPPGLLVVLIREFNESAMPTGEQQNVDSAEAVRQPPETTRFVQNRDIDREARTEREQEAVRAYQARDRRFGGVTSER